MNMWIKLNTLVLCAVATLVLHQSAVANTAEIDKQRSVIANLEKQIANGEKEIATLRRDKAANEKRVTTLVQQIEARNRLLKVQSAEAAALRKEISSLDKTTSELSEELDSEMEGYAEMVREAYRNYQGRTLLRYLFTADDFNDLARRVSNVRALAIVRENRMKHIDSLSSELSQQRSVLVKSSAELDKVVADLTRQRTSLQSDVNSARAAISSMTSQERKTIQQSELAKRQLDTEIQKLQKLIVGNQTGASFTTKTTGLTLPVAGGRVKQYMENMAEILGSKGAKVTSVYAGKVVDVKRSKITNKYDVYIAHGEYITSYGGLSEVSVDKDQTVMMNQPIGVIGEAVNIITRDSEYKIVFGVYPPKSTDKMSAASCFKK